MVASTHLLTTLSALAPTIVQAYSHTQRFHHPHRLAIRDVPVSQWIPLGCYTDNVNGAGRTLASASFTNTTGMTTESCISFCDQQGFVYAGTEFSQECYCGDFFANGGTNTTASDCNMACTGNSAEICGAGNRLSVFWSGVTPPPPPSTVASVGLWESLGCYSDGAPRTLTVTMDPTGPNSIETCTASCFNAGYPLAGTEFADECYCGLTISNGGAPTSLGDCDMPCTGNSSEFCGGPNRLNMYNFTGTLPHGPVPPVGGGGNNNAPVSPVLTGLPSNFSYVGCYVDNAFGRIFNTEIPDNQNLTIQGCVETCVSQNFTVAGTEFGVQCFCGTELVNGAVPAIDGCSMGCGGNATEACGGPNQLSVYSTTGNVTALPVPIVKTTGLPGQWAYQGCLQEPGANRVFPYQIINATDTTVEGCLSQCSAFGYPAGGLEFGDECWCGDVSDVAANSPGFGAESDCVIPCSGDPIHLCGGAERLQYYAWNGTLNLWHTPANTGRYEFLVPGVVVPLVVTLGVNNKVAMLEKSGTSEFANSTGAYELDLTLVDHFDLAWREMHVKSDVFCSGSIILPDKGARQLNVGGWSLDSTQGVRLYWPDGSAGVNGTNDWQENFQELHLQRMRWYPTAMILANGSIMVVGGELGSNGAPEPSLEILPKPNGTGDTWKFLDYLNRTDPNNLYPFLHVLPSGRIFIGYYNEARILDPVSLDTFQVLPNMPGSVTSPLAGRTYPMEGTAVLLPQHAPYTDPVTVLVCGGSNFGIALDNCVSIQPEATNPTWTLERMPSKRVMTCMAALPDGTFLIVNGAQQGVAGFGLADDPNLTALLYDPSQPVNQRISILNETIVARLYHSEAILLYDGRVLISGSDPQTNNPDGTPKFPEEMRIEVYVPPYLTQGLTQPNFTIAETDWSYGGSYQINVHLFHGTTSTMRVSLIAATSSTHGNSMGGRTIFPAFKCSGTVCTITAPPNANVSPPGWHQLFVLDGPTPSFSKWVRIGGDPAKLGNWPEFPDFTVPGV
ncbi:copper radical oxidase [Cytidiella melzeri]|nr:copper radical oxidase [Cytidiella melzeri]